MIKTLRLHVPIHTVIAAGTVWCVLYGTSRGETPTDCSVELGDFAAEHRRLRLRTTTKFTRAVFLSPVHNASAGRGVWMAPLLLQEMRAESGNTLTFPKFGAITVTASSEYSVDETRPTVYTTSRQILVGDRPYRQATYVWFYPPVEPGKSPRYRGFRQTIGRKGFPLIREVISSETTKRVFFVSKSLERAAAQQFGPPLAGRQFSVEPPISEHRNVVVARVLANGAQPMGPFVYLDNSTLAIPNLKCRCEPSQVGQFAFSLPYELVTLSSFETLSTGGIQAEDVNLPADAVQLAGVLRLPTSM